MNQRTKLGYASIEKINVDVTKSSATKSKEATTQTVGIKRNNAPRSRAGKQPRFELSFNEARRTKHGSRRDKKNKSAMISQEAPEERKSAPAPAIQHTKRCETQKELRDTKKTKEHKIAPAYPGSKNASHKNKNAQSSTCSTKEQVRNRKREKKICREPRRLGGWKTSV